jgi:hypothetical protein
MRRAARIGHTLQRGAQHFLGTAERARKALRRGGLDGMRALRGTDAFNVELVMQSASCIDWAALGPWMEAVDARVGSPLPQAVYKLHVLATWFSLDPQTLASACNLRAEFRRFIGAALHGPIVDVQLYLEHVCKLPRARDALAKLDAAVELQLIDHGFLAPSDVLSKLDLGKAPGIAAPTLVLPRNQASIATSNHSDPAERSPLAIDSTVAHTSKQPDIGLPVLIWPWGMMTLLTDGMPVGRDAAFCKFAEHLAADRKVSRRHALLTPVDGGVLVEDLGASNGTYADDEPITYATARLVASDTCLRFGTDLAVMLTFVPEP